MEKKIVKDFSATTWVRILKFGTKLDSDELYCVTKEQPHIAYQSLYLFIFLSLQWKFLCYVYPRYEVYREYIVFAFSVIMFVCLSVNFFFSSKISQQLLGLGF